MSIAKQILMSAKLKIKDPQSWGQRHYATDVSGMPVYISSDHAVRFCLIGAVSRATRDRARDVYGDEDEKNFDEACDALIAALPKSFNGGLALYNDSHSHRSVVRLINKAINLL